MTNCKDKIEINIYQKMANVPSQPRQVLSIIDFLFFPFFQRDNTQADTTVPIRIFPSCIQVVMSYHLCLFSHRLVEINVSMCTARGVIFYGK